MPEFLARKRKGVIVPHDDDLEEFEKIPEGTIIKVKTTNPRSRPHLGLFFGAMKCAFDNWPSGEEFQPETVEHLRQFCEIKSGHRMALTVALTGGKGFIKNLSAAIAHAQGTGTKQKYVFLTNTAKDVYVITARSIAYDKLSQEEFNTVSSRVSEVLREHTGIGLEEYKMNMGKVA